MIFTKLELDIFLIFSFIFSSILLFSEISVRFIFTSYNVLVEKGCADPYGTNGHDPEAEQLKQDIDKMLEELGAEPEPPDSDSDEEQQGGGKEQEEKQKSFREEQLEKDLNEQKEESMQERREADNKKQYSEDSGSSESGGGSGSSYDDLNQKNW